MELRLTRGEALYQVRRARTEDREIVEVRTSRGDQEAVTQVSVDARRVAPGEFLMDGPAGPRRGYAVRDGGIIWVHWAGTTFRFRVARGAGDRAAEASPAAVVSPMPGQVLRLLVEVGDRVAQGQPLLVVEAMKMQLEVAAPHDGVVAALPFAVGDKVDVGVPLADVTADAGE